jgi:hypothetical protein
MVRESYGMSHQFGGAVVITGHRSTVTPEVDLVPDDGPAPAVEG